MNLSQYEHKALGNSPTIGQQVNVKNKKHLNTCIQYGDLRVPRKVGARLTFHCYGYWTFSTGSSVLEMNFTDSLDHLSLRNLSFPTPISLHSSPTFPRDSVFRLVSAWLTTYDSCILHSREPALSINIFCVASKSELISLEMLI